MSDLLSLVRALIPAVRAAGELEMRYFRAGVEATGKSDGSPVTKADREAEALLAEALAKLSPGLPVVGEEETAEGRVPDVSGGTFFLIDALDGTRGFVRGAPDFTVNVALVEGGRPVMGIVHAPATGALYHGADGAAFRDGETILVRRAPEEGLTVIASRRADTGRLAEFLKGRAVCETLLRSSSIKFCVIAEGGADLYPRLGPTSEWDTAAGEAILVAAGGAVTGLGGKPLVYGKAAEKFLNPAFMARGAV
jgi:3'(2'), 5'-bisphosphate nucleotidase